MNFKRGFTLIELLVVIGIIALLTGIMVFAVEGSRVGARDDRRKVDLKAIQAGLEEFYSHCRQYPSNDYYTARVGGQLNGDNTIASQGWQTCVSTNVFMDELPDDPMKPTFQYRYNKISDSEYVLCAHLENPVTVMSGSCGGNCGTESCNYVVESPR